MMLCTETVRRAVMPCSVHRSLGGKSGHSGGYVRREWGADNSKMEYES